VATGVVIVIRMYVVVAEAHPYFQDARAFLCQDWQMAPEYTHLWDLCNPDAV
jgi:hypothetical protein